MQALEQLVGEARVLAGAPAAEVARVMQICNACRYCEGFCAVFPAMTRRLAFSPADAHYLANLCHNCGACLHACQYAPPHEFAVNVPQAMARVRLHTYQAYAWPQPLAALYRRNGLTLALALVAALTLLLAWLMARNGTSALWQAQPGGNFYALLPHGAMVALFGPVFGAALLALGVGVVRFWRLAPPGPPPASAWAEAAQDALRLKHLGGGHGDGCNNEDDAFTLARRRAHHAAFYGFLLCLAATTLATLYHYAWGWAAPYAYTSGPKLLGTAGGVLMLLGGVQQWRLHRRRHPLQGDAAQNPMDRGFIALLLATAASGLLLTALRATPALAGLLALHLACVLALFATMPYGKFAHGFYRGAALLRWAAEKRRPHSLGLAQE